MDENEKVELMYRRPGSDEYELLTDVVDDILKRLGKLELTDDIKVGLTN